MQPSLLNFTDLRNVREAGLQNCHRLRERQHRVSDYWSPIGVSYPHGHCNFALWIIGIIPSWSKGSEKVLRQRRIPCFCSEWPRSIDPPSRNHGPRFSDPCPQGSGQGRRTWVIPCEFASDNKHEKVNQETNLMTRKNKDREQIEELGVSSWIGIINNPWFDWSFKRTYCGIDIKTRTTTPFDTGVVKCNNTTLRKVGKSPAAPLSLPDSKLSQFKNDFVYFSSFCISQCEILDSVMRVTSTQESDWLIRSESAVEAAEAVTEAIRKGHGMKKVNLLFATLFREGYWGECEAKGTVDQMLGFEEEDLNDNIKELVQQIQAGSWVTETYLCSNHR
jgi:hypothetical protein